MNIYEESTLNFWICGRSVVFSGGIPVLSTNKTDRHDITEILLKVALNTIHPLYSKVINKEYKCKTNAYSHVIPKLPKT